MWICIEEYILFAFEFRPKHIYIQMALASKWKNYGNEDAISDDQILQLAQLEQNAYLFTLERTTFCSVRVCSLLFVGLYSLGLSFSLSIRILSVLRCFRVYAHTHRNVNIYAYGRNIGEFIYTASGYLSHVSAFIYMQYGEYLVINRIGEHTEKTGCEAEKNTSRWITTHSH